ncbi:MAG: YvcK family protein [Clostridiales bacterium]|nr:YvcK family protein [Clostridiales bacterium]
MNESITPGSSGTTGEIVVIGGGTGLSVMLRGLKKRTDRIAAVVAVSDDGGGSGKLRNDMGILPPGDIRNCIMALSNTEPIMSSLLTYRFTEGELKGQCFGNLFIAALNRITGSFYQAVRYMSDVLAITGRVLPVTVEDVHIEAEFGNGVSVRGESKILRYKKMFDSPIKSIRMIPEKPKALDDTIDAIENARMIVFGPGSLYTSVIPNLLVDGIVDAIERSRAKKVYVCNVMTQDGETEKYTAFDHVKAVFEHSGEGIFDTCIVNNMAVSGTLAERYAKEGAESIDIDRERFREAGIKLIELPLLDENTNLARHDPDKLAGALMDVLEGDLNGYDLFGENQGRAVQNTY